MKGTAAFTFRISKLRDIAENGAIVVFRHSDYYIIVIIEKHALTKLAESEYVLGIASAEALPEPSNRSRAPNPGSEYGRGSAEISRVDVVNNAPYGITGHGVTVGVWETEGGIARDHPEFGVDRFVAVDQGTVASHATHVTGTIIARGDDQQAKGMAPDAHARGWTKDGHITEKETEYDQSLIRVDNNSWGDNWGWRRYSACPGGEIWHWIGFDRQFGQYRGVEHEIDEFVTDGELTVTPLTTWASGNDRDDGPGSAPFCLGTDCADCGHTNHNQYPSTDGSWRAGYQTVVTAAKNALVVGAIYDRASDVITPDYSDSDLTSSDYSGWGPTKDGRFKPDLVTNGGLTALAWPQNAGVYSTSCGQQCNNGNDYEERQGTSMAAPVVTGIAALLVEQMIEQYGQSSKTNTSSSELKAILIHTAMDRLYEGEDESAFPPRYHDPRGPDYRYGWGLADAKEAVDLLRSSFESTGYAVRGQFTTGAPVCITIEHYYGELKATLVWHDLPGFERDSSPEGSPKEEEDYERELRNDLDLVIRHVETMEDGLSRSWYHPYQREENKHTLTEASLGEMAARPAERGVNNTDNVEQAVMFTSEIDDADPPLTGTWEICVDSVSDSTAVTTDQAFSLILPRPPLATPRPAPNNGILTIGSHVTIDWEWDATADAQSQVKVEITRDNQKSWEELTSGYHANTGSFNWTVTGPASGKCRFRIWRDGEFETYRTSADRFLIEETDFWLDSGNPEPPADPSPATEAEPVLFSARFFDPDHQGASEVTLHFATGETFDMAHVSGDSFPEGELWQYSVSQGFGPGTWEYWFTAEQAGNSTSDGSYYLQVNPTIPSDVGVSFDKNPVRMHEMTRVTAHVVDEFGRPREEIEVRFSSSNSGAFSDPYGCAHVDPGDPSSPCKAMIAGVPSASVQEVADSLRLTSLVSRKVAGNPHGGSDDGEEFIWPARAASERREAL